MISDAMAYECDKLNAAALALVSADPWTKRLKDSADQLQLVDAASLPADMGVYLAKVARTAANIRDAGDLDLNAIAFVSRLFNLRDRALLLSAGLDPVTVLGPIETTDVYDDDYEG